MARLILVTGGSRSGKSSYAQKLAESLPGSRAFIATCTVADDEMRGRVSKHQQARRRGGWRTIEEPLDLPGALRRAMNQPVVLVDCLTLWVSNVMFDAAQREKTVSETQIARQCKETLAACREHNGTILFVTNEVGMGIVPENAVSRRFRDLAGRTNQMFAAACDEVFFVVSGQALKIKT